MITYPLRESDLDQLKEIHEKYYREEFRFPDFYRNFLSTFKLVDKSGNLLLAGGVKTFAELILITNLDESISRTDRVISQVTAMQLGTHSAFSAGHDLLYCSAIPNTKWEQQLIDVGFKPSSGNMLYIS